MRKEIESFSPCVRAKQGLKIEGVVLHRVGIFGSLCRGLINRTRVPSPLRHPFTHISIKYPH